MKQTAQHRKRYFSVDFSWCASTWPTRFQSSCGNHPLPRDKIIGPFIVLVFLMHQTHSTPRGLWRTNPFNCLFVVLCTQENKKRVYVIFSSLSIVFVLVYFSEIVQNDLILWPNSVFLGWRGEVHHRCATLQIFVTSVQRHSVNIWHCLQNNNYRISWPSHNLTVNGCINEWVVAWLVNMQNIGWECVHVYVHTFHTANTFVRCSVFTFCFLLCH